MNYELRSGKISVLISSLGAEIVCLRDEKGNDYIWTGEEQVWKRNAPALFPIIGSLYDGKYKYNGDYYNITKHGFLRDMEGAVDYYDSNRISFSFKSNEKTLKMYPFKFEISVMYELSVDGIILKYLVKNLDDKQMYFSLGFHPGFLLPFGGDDAKFEDYYVSFDADGEVKRINITMDGFLTGEKTPFEQNEVHLTREMFENEAIILENTSKKVCITSDKSDKQIVMEFPYMNYMTLWTLPREDAQFVCVEPWTSLVGEDGKVLDLKDIENIVSLEAGGFYKNEVAIFIENKK